MSRLSDANEALGIAHKRSVALVIRHRARRSDLLLVQRPPDDGEFPRLWGLPAASLREQESWHDAARRIGTSKLGVDLRIGTELARGSQMRREGSIEMRLYDAAVQVGQHPAVPGEDETVTQYTTWRWGEAERVRQSAIRGSLCSQLLLQLTAREEEAAQAAADRATQHAARSADAETGAAAPQRGEAEDPGIESPSSDDRGA
jgi:8-oxo-dGTP diphosphatase